MTTASLGLRPLPPRLRTPAILIGSVALHALVLGFLGLRAIQLEPGLSSPPVVLLEIEPRPLLKGETAREPRYAAPAEASTATSASRAEPGAVALPRPEDEEDERAAAEAAAPGRPIPAPSPAEQGIDDAWRVPSGVTGRQLGRSLRGSMIGCDAMQGRLSAGEQAQCDERFAGAAGRAAPIEGSGDARRDARFAAQGRREIEAYEGRRRPLGGGTGVVPLGDCPGSNFGTGCPGAHLDRGFRQDNRDMMDEVQGRPPPRPGSE